MPFKVSIQTVAERTGLTAHAIRAWERRYQAIEPTRSPGKHRLYSEEDIYRLSLLAQATRSGRMISRLCRLENTELAKLLQEEARNPSGTSGGRPFALSTDSSGADCRQILDRIMVFVRNFDTQGLDDTLSQAEVALGNQGLLRQIIDPMARLLGDEWRAGHVTLAQEHFFTSMAKGYLWNFTRQFRRDDRAPKIVVGTPLGQLHELGAVMVASAAASNGWKVSFVGASLPASELVHAVNASGACALALSIVYPEDDATLVGELRQLGVLLPHHIQLFAGGRASPAYSDALYQAGGRLLSSLDDLDRELNSMRRVPVHNPAQA